MEVITYYMSYYKFLISIVVNMQWNNTNRSHNTFSQEGWTLRYETVPLSTLKYLYRMDYIYSERQ